MTLQNCLPQAQRSWRHGGGQVTFHYASHPGTQPSSPQYQATHFSVAPSEIRFFSSGTLEPAPNPPPAAAAPSGRAGQLPTRCPRSKWRRRRLGTARRAERFRRGPAGCGAAAPGRGRGRGHGHGRGWRCRWRCRRSAAAGAARLRGRVLALLAGPRRLRRRAVLRHRRCGAGRGGMMAARCVLWCG